ncbi:PAQR family membrane homeostasis protein TrhA [Clostridium chauvoei]|uniref:Hemolysin III family protein n=3 Tax=Clostridium chauvoei TaxID=46867 RepID=A0ABD4RJ24_9CLOT|nr:hemolysin III family protein [Clostridium chauvoei]ATD55888.1 hemolysin D [Clostridium chauvoei]ATD56440.1 hemolysin D [Clostridium chauvoei]MBX7281142.1 hemolysin III family protein [Clostridium chauvoei]MBX7283624.1 hemolysin III family protein [Clostridium chauvoei]MBX7286232.1 hemolysin III family protein [Clostridium chauvoei]
MSKREINKSVEYNFYTKGEEIANAITHGVGTILAIIGTVFLLMLAIESKNMYKIIGASVYSFCLIILYLDSTLYHSLPGKVTKRVFRIFDHSSIYLLIAGTYTPLLLILLNQDKRSMIILTCIWIMAVIGIIFKAIWVGRFELLSTLIYIFMGWAIVFNVKTILLVVPGNILLYLLIGGIAYTLGCIFFSLDKMPYNHAIWHLFVMAGSVLHYIAVFLCVLL